MTDCPLALQNIKITKPGSKRC